VLVSVELLTTTYEKLLITKVGSDSGDVKEFETNHVLKVVDAFDMPAWRWAEESKTFEK
jgi:DNA polymerase epsilon subunit 2